jgi:hypothetical protein
MADLSGTVRVLVAPQSIPICIDTALCILICIVWQAPISKKMMRAIGKGAQDAPLLAFGDDLPLLEAWLLRY